METTIINPSDYHLLKQAVDALAQVCDGADARDDEGFDGADTRAGHLLAFLPLEAWPLSAFYRAWKWTRKYHRQLQAMQLDCSDLPQPPVCEGSDRHIALQSQEDGFYVIFPYDDELIEAFRHLPGGEVHRVTIGQNDKLTFRYRTVRLVAGAGAALLAFASRYAFTLGQSVQERAQQGAGDAEAVLAYRVVMEEEHSAFALYFPRIEALNQEVKAIAGRRPSGVGGFHWLIPATPQAMQALRNFLRLHPQFFVSEEARSCLGLASAISR
jgi:hypothetical protein